MSLINSLVSQAITINEVAKQAIAIVVLVDSIIQLFRSISPLCELREVLFTQRMVQDCHFVQDFLEL